MGKASNDNNPGGGQPLKAPCPICSEPSVHQYRPFCSKRCADIDLGRWMRGSYVIAADPGGEEAESIPPFEQLNDEDY